MQRNGFVRHACTGSRSASSTAECRRSSCPSPRDRLRPIEVRADGTDCRATCVCPDRFARLHPTAAGTAKLQAKRWTFGFIQNGRGGRMTPRTNLIALQRESERETVQALGTHLGTAIASTMQPRANVLGVQVDAIDMNTALVRIGLALTARQKGYVCVAGVHGIMEAQRDPEVREAYADAFMTIP